MKAKLLAATFAFAASAASVCLAGDIEKFGINYDEDRVTAYILPDVLLNPQSGKEVQSAEEWLRCCRPYILAEFENLYSPIPPRPLAQRFEVLEASDALGGKAVRKQVRAFFKSGGEEKSIDILIYIPKGAKGPVAVFAGLNFAGNHTVSADEEILISKSWSRNFDNIDLKITDNRAHAEHRDKMARRWPLEKIIDAGYGIMTAWYCDIYPDRPDGAQESVYKIFTEEEYPYEPKAVAAWSWALMRMLDYAQTDPALDASKVISIGHSRLGKTALVAAAFDARFAAAISNDSGCMGAALSKRQYGENIARITNVFPHWFSDNLKIYAGNEGALSVDQHQLLATIAPRPIYVASASEDRWADPKGELTSLIEAGKVYGLFGSRKFPTLSAFEIEKPFLGDCGYHMRNGKHDITFYDWDNYIKFADKLVK